MGKIQFYNGHYDDEPSREIKYDNVDKQMRMVSKQIEKKLRLNYWLVQWSYMMRLETKHIDQQCGQKMIG